MTLPGKKKTKQKCVRVQEIIYYSEGMNISGKSVNIFGFLKQNNREVLMFELNVYISLLELAAFIFLEEAKGTSQSSPYSSIHSCYILFGIY